VSGENYVMRSVIICTSGDLIENEMGGACCAKEVAGADTGL
jgi:hypothetical protein